MSQPITDRERERVDYAMAEGHFSEPNATKAMGALLANDTAAAGRLVKAVVRHLRPEEAVEVPGHLNCRANVRFYGRTLRGPDRYADFAFYSINDNFLLFVEAKLGAGTSDKQIADYIHVKRDSVEIPQGHTRWWTPPRGSTIRVALLSRKAMISRDVNRARRAVSGERSERWLGGSTWLEISGVLKQLTFASADRTRCWGELLAHYSGPRGLGIERGAELSIEQLLDGTVLSLSRRTADLGAFEVLPWDYRTEKVVRKNQRGAAFRGRWGHGQRNLVTVTVRAPADHQRLQLEVRGATRCDVSHVPAEALGDVEQFQCFLKGCLQASRTSS